MRSFISIIVFALFSISGQAQTFAPVVEDSVDFVITGTTPSTHDSVAWFLVAPYRQCLVPRVPIENGRFCVKGRLPRHTFLQIGDFADNDLQFIVDDVPTDINLATGEMTGSALQHRFIECQLRQRVIARSVESWWDSLGEERQDSIRLMEGGDVKPVTPQDSADLERFSSAMADMNACGRQNIRLNLDNVIPAYYLHIHYGSLTPAEKQEFMREDAAYAHHPAMERVWKRYWGEEQQRTMTGTPYRDFAASDSLGKVHRLADYVDGKHYVLLDFWASWCGPCIGSFPHMRQLHEQYKDRGLRILGISVDKDRDAWLSALQIHHNPWQQLYGGKKNEDGQDAGDLYGVVTIPALVLIAPDGNVIATDKDLGTIKMLDGKLEEIFEKAREKHPSGVQALFDKYKTLEDVAYEDMTQQKNDSIPKRFAEETNPALLAELKAMRIEFLSVEENDSLASAMRGDITALRGYEKTDASKYFTIPPMLRALLNEAEGFSAYVRKVTDNKVDDLLIVMDGCIFLLIHVEGPVTPSLIPRVLHLDVSGGE